MEFNKTVMTGAVVSVDTTMVVASHMDIPVRQSVNVEHLQHQQMVCQLSCMHMKCICLYYKQNIQHVMQELRH